MMNCGRLWSQPYTAIFLSDRTFYAISIYHQIAHYWRRYLFALLWKEKKKRENKRHKRYCSTHTKLGEPREYKRKPEAREATFLV